MELEVVRGSGLGRESRVAIGHIQIWNSISFLLKNVSVDVEDVSNKELKMRINKYFEDGDEQELQSPQSLKQFCKESYLGTRED
ncbi:MRP-S28 domain-containing protein [Quillaja saponaria]|uniref:MRP-S28 domain-containing protein n=1 Tax=Quillaja saponaria TaxID=32244 RepID=A0AAD7Q5B6_QUISA|nr:MRP-S28 domain-containing protein [Quillaja saponaria]